MRSRTTVGYRVGVPTLRRRLFRFVVRFWGLMRETPGANPEPFDEIWHVRKSMKDRKGSWVIAGIQQTAETA